MCDSIKCDFCEGVIVGNNAFDIGGGVFCEECSTRAQDEQEAWLEFQSYQD